MQLLPRHTEGILHAVAHRLIGDIRYIEGRFCLLLLLLQQGRSVETLLLLSLFLLQLLAHFRHLFLLVLYVLQHLAVFGQGFFACVQLLNLLQRRFRLQSIALFLLCLHLLFLLYQRGFSLVRCLLSLGNGLFEHRQFALQARTLLLLTGNFLLRRPQLFQLLVQTLRLVEHCAMRFQGL